MSRKIHSRRSVFLWVIALCCNMCPHVPSSYLATYPILAVCNSVPSPSYFVLHDDVDVRKVVPISFMRISWRPSSILGSKHIKHLATWLNLLLSVITNKGQSISQYRQPKTHVMMWYVQLACHAVMLSYVNFCHAIINMSNAYVDPWDMPNNFCFHF